jgi:ADP-ribosylglycohydrolase
MTIDEAKRVIATLRAGRAFEVSNSMYGRWSFVYDEQRQQFNYQSEFWGDDPENPTSNAEWLSEAELTAKLCEHQLGFEPHFASFVGENPTQSCPLCGSAVRPNPRYQAYVCDQCARTATDAAGRSVRFYNTDMAGGCEGRHADDETQYPSSRCWIDGIECQAGEARFGGIVIQPIAPVDAARDRKLGALLGLAVGDALGTTHEFERMKAPRFPELARGPLRDIVGDGPFRVQAGQVTDDTHMAICLAESIRACGGFDAEDVAARYITWTEHAFDIGNQTRAALDIIRDGYSARGAGRRIWLERDGRPAGNGSLMRTAPIGVMIADADARRAAALAESAITHFDPRCQLACAAFDAAIATGIATGIATEMLDAAERELVVATELLVHDVPDEASTIQQAVRDLRIDFAVARTADPQLYGPEINLHDQQGFVRVALRLAFWHLAHTASVEDALIDTVNRGGDADTNAAIVGALLGACYGQRALPARWRHRVLHWRANDSSLGTTYHPRRFLELFDR